MLSCAPIGKHDDLTRYSSNGWNARKRVFQDVQQWMKDGIMDAIFPMMYFRDNHFFPFALDWNEHSYGKFVVPGLGIYFLDPKEGKWVITDVERQMKMISHQADRMQPERNLFMHFAYYVQETNIISTVFIDR